MKIHGYYDCDVAKLSLQFHATRWLETPFHAHAAVCKAGVDCVNLCARIYIETGFLKEVNLPPYTLDGGRHNQTSQLIRWIEESGKFALVNDSQIGDLLCFDQGRSEHHAGMQCGETLFIHALPSRGVILTHLSNSIFKRKLRAIYRPLASAESPIIFRHGRDARDTHCIE